MAFDDTPLDSSKFAIALLTLIVIFPWVWINIEILLDIYYRVTDRRPERVHNINKFKLKKLEPTADTSMFTNDITLAGDASSSTTYALLSIADGKSVRGNAAAPLGQPQTLTISHGVTKRGSLMVDRHLARLDKTKLDASNAPVGAAVYTVLEVPRNATITEAEINDMCTQLKNLLSAGNIDKLLNGEP